MDYYNQIKEELINNEVYKKVKDYSKNRGDLSTYYNVGKLLIEAQGGEGRAKYGDNLIKEYSVRLTKEIGKGYTATNLKYMRQFYLFCEKSHALRDQLSWTHYRELIFMNDIDKHIKTINQDRTIGIIICAKDNKIILEYLSDFRIFETSYILN